MKDTALIRGVLRGDRSAGEELIDRYYDEIYRYAYRQSASTSDPRATAQDLTQEIFISMMHSLPTYSAGKASFRTWLYYVANSRIIDSRRKFQPNEVQIDETEVLAETDIIEDLHHKDLLRRIEESIAFLPSEVQRIIRLHLYAELPFSQISESMGLPEATVKTKFYRAIRRIREEYHNEF